MPAIAAPDPTSWVFDEDGERPLTVYQFARPGAPAVLLLHELPGMSRNCQGFGWQLHEAGFDVHMPLLFGARNQNKAGKGLYQMICLNREFALLWNNRSSPIADRLRAICRKIATGDNRVGVIGMCATGGMVFSLMFEPAVGAAVAAQPAMPFRAFWTGKSDRKLGASQEDVAKSRDSGKPLLALRFTWDGICPANRLRHMEETFGDQYEQHIASGNGLLHATLTQHADASDGAVERTIGFLQANLQGAGE